MKSDHDSGKSLNAQNNEAARSTRFFRRLFEKLQIRFIPEKQSNTVDIQIPRWAFEILKKTKRKRTEANGTDEVVGPEKDGQDADPEYDFVEIRRWQYWLIRVILFFLKRYSS
jgi:hypothetical protein